MIVIFSELDFGVGESLDGGLGILDGVEVDERVGMIGASGVRLTDAFDFGFMRFGEHVLDLFDRRGSNPDLSGRFTPVAGRCRRRSGGCVGGFSGGDVATIVGGCGERRCRWFDGGWRDDVLCGGWRRHFFAGGGGWEGDLSGVLFDGLTTDGFDATFRTAVVEIEAYVR